MRTRRWYVRVLCLMLVLSACAANHEPGNSATGSATQPLPTPTLVTPSSLPDRRVSRMAADIDAYVSRLTSDGAFSGVILVVYKGELVLEQGYGWADSEQQVRNSAATRFRISSLSKAFAATAILLLQQQGRLDVNDAICAYVDRCPTAWEAITIHHLLTHTSGLPDYTRTLDFWESSATQGTSVEALLSQIAQLQPVAQPGAQFLYSSSNYVLLGAIIARVAHPELPPDRGYYRFLETAIFAPLHLEAVGSENCEDQVGALAVGFVAQDIRAVPCSTSAFYAMGDLYATAHDLYRWGQAMDNDHLLPAAARAAMVTPYVKTPGLQTGYGYGWYITEIGGVRTIWHDGATPGYRSFLQRTLGEETMVIILSNFEVSPVGAMGREIAATLIRRSTDSVQSGER